MKRFPSILLTNGVTAGLLFAAGHSLAQSTLFSDNFAASTLNSATPASPTASATSYESVSTGPLTASSIAAGHLTLNMGTTSGNGYQIQALFASSPVALATVGDSLQLNVTFTDTGGFLTTANGTLCAGLFNTGQVFPWAGGVANENSSFNNAAIGGAQGWVGYAGQITTNHTYFLTRAAQTGTQNNNQDLVFGAGAGSINSSTKGYANPAATSLGTGNGSVFLAANGQYTMSLTCQLTAADTLTLTGSLYSGADTSGTLLSSYATTASGANFLTNSFDGLAFGFYANKNQATAIDINQVTVIGTVQPVPEPSVTALAGLGLLGMLGGARFRRF